jgi:hypothetical protein
MHAALGLAAVGVKVLRDATFTKEVSHHYHWTLLPRRQSYSHLLFLLTGEEMVRRGHDAVLMVSFLYLCI